MKNLAICISLFMLCVLSKAHAQFQKSKEIKIAGKVLDKKNKQPMPFVHVTHKEKRTNFAVTDKDGNFSFTAYFVDQEDFTVRFSFVGYKNFDYLIKISKPKNISDLTIYLEEDIYQLKAITIDGKREETSLSILKKVIENLDKNYTDKSFSYNYLYREVAKDTGAYSRLTEAHISTFWKDGFKADEERIARVNQCRSSLDFSKFKKGMPIIDITLKNNHHWIRQRSMIFKMENLGKFEVKALEYNLFGKEYLYKIEFSTDKEPYITCEGTIYVSDGDFAVRKIEIDYAPSFVHFAETYDSLREKSLLYYVYSTYKEVQTFEKKADTYFMTYQLVHSKNRHVDETTSEDEYENEVWIEHFIDDIQFVTEEEYTANWIGTMSYHGLDELNYDKDFWQKNKAVVNFPIDSQIVKDLEKKIPLKSQFEQRK